MGCKAVMEALLRAGADVGVKNNRGKTPLGLAKEKWGPDSEVVALLEGWGRS
ncbi:hypothetical protein TSOC_007095 [Tetrabaena socialis]|uniref:Uncharacterized protein n=1 Tax=Tetrabaena socialis TaxID=47790 RepID=A0A2J8A1Y8_9CHLO|nr:hypothetical protein TSOC_007095 [Tetrabaena socialis]|eukprot:PNH06524.1 hypothetical protein TSOC_007095 [Tetrabaena socialis]